MHLNQIFFTSAHKSSAKQSNNIPWKEKKATAIVDALCLKLCVFSEGCTFCVRPSAWGISIAQTASWLKLLEVIIYNFVTALMSVQHCRDLMRLSRDRCVTEVSFLC